VLIEELQASNAGIVLSHSGIVANHGTSAGIERHFPHVYPAVGTVNKDIALGAFIHGRRRIGKDNLAASSFFDDYFIRQFYLPLY
jgi:hypothetical protein